MKQKREERDNKREEGGWHINSLWKGL